LRAAVPPNGTVVLESTPQGAGGSFYEEWQRANESGYTRHFFPWWYAREYATDNRRAKAEVAGDLTPEERALCDRHKLSLAQIAFRRELRANFRGLAPQEYAEDPMSCFLASGECVFEIEAVERQLAGAVPPLDSRDNGRLQVWYPPRPEAVYVVGVDPAGGGSDGDYACAQVVERGSGLQCAELHGHYTPRELAKRVGELAEEYNRALVAVERNNHGAAVLVYLDEVLQYPNLYCERGQPGWLTTSASRAWALELFASVVAREPGLFSSRRLLQECRSFGRQADGSSSAAPGAHDDCVMAMAIAQAVRLQGSARSRAAEVEFGSIARA
jgi:hypothetical protein